MSKSAQEMVDHYARIALANGGSVGGPARLPEPIGSDGKTEGQHRRQSVQPEAPTGDVTGPKLSTVITLAKGHALEPSGGMNKTEAAYAAHLELRKLAGEVAWYGFEAVKLRLADRTFYTPDFMVMLSDGLIEFHETKATWSTGKAGFKDDARVKVKVAAKQFPMFRFVVVNKVKATWHEERL